MVSVYRFYRVDLTTMITNLPATFQVARAWVLGIGFLCDIGNIDINVSYSLIMLVYLCEIVNSILIKFVFGMV